MVLEFKGNIQNQRTFLYKDLTHEVPYGTIQKFYVCFIFKPWDHLLQSECVRKEPYTVLSRIVYFGGNFEGRVKVLPQNGSLSIQNLGWSDRGKYSCHAWNNIQHILSITNQTNGDSRFPETLASPKDTIPRNQSYSSDPAAQEYKGNSIKLIIDNEYRWTIYRLSLVYGFATAGGFLLVTLLAKLVCFLLHK